MQDSQVWEFLFQRCALPLWKVESIQQVNPSLQSSFWGGLNMIPLIHLYRNGPFWYATTGFWPNFETRPVNCFFVDILILQNPHRKRGANRYVEGRLSFQIHSFHLWNPMRCVCTIYSGGFLCCLTRRIRDLAPMLTVSISNILVVCTYQTYSIHYMWKRQSKSLWNRWQSMQRMCCAVPQVHSSTMSPCYGTNAFVKFRPCHYLERLLKNIQPLTFSRAPVQSRLGHDHLTGNQGSLIVAT